MISGHTYINRYRASSQNVEDYENILKRALIEVTGRSCGWTKGSPYRNMVGGYLVIVIVIVLCNILVIVFTVSAPLSAEHGL